MFGSVRRRQRRTGAVLVAAAEGLALLAFAVTFAMPAGAQNLGGNPYKFMRRDYQRQQDGGGGFFGGFFGRSDTQREPRHYRSAPQVRRQVDYSHAPPPQKQQSQPDPSKPITSIVVMGGSMADWLAYGLEDAFSDSPNVEIVRKDEPNSGLLRYKAKSDLDWWHVAREDLAHEKANFVVMMLGVTDRQNIRESDIAKEATQETPKSEPGQNAADAAKAGQGKDATDTKDAKDNKPVPASSHGVLAFRSPQWERVYTRRIDKTIAALKSKGVPVFWVGLPSIRGTKSTADAVYLNNLYRQRAERAGIVYIDVWDGFVDDSGKYSSYGPDYEGQTRRLRSSDGVFFTKYGARKLAHYVEREIRRYMTNRVTTLALPSGPLGPAPGAAPKSAVRPLAGPVLPLTAPTGNSDVLLGGAQTPPPRPDAIATNVLVKGNALSAPPGRADDFKWPPDGQDYGKPPAPDKTSQTNTTSPAADARKAAAAQAQAEAEQQAREKAVEAKAAEAKAQEEKAQEVKAQEEKAKEAQARDKARREAELRRHAAERARAEARQGLRPPGRVETRREYRPQRRSDDPIRNLFGVFGN